MNVALKLLGVREAREEAVGDHAAGAIDDGGTLEKKEIKAGREEGGIRGVSWSEQDDDDDGSWERTLTPDP